jgi:arsenate reductase
MERRMSESKKQKVIFLCTGNSARSQMAEAFLRKYADDRFEAYSAGLDPKGINPLTVQVMEEISISLEGQHSKSVGEYLGKVHFPYLFTVCSNAEKNCPRTFLSSGNHTYWDFEDPAAFEGTDEEKLAKFREVRDQIDDRIKNWLTETEG